MRPILFSRLPHRFEEDFPGAVRCALTETHRLPVHLLRSATGLMRAGRLVPLLNRRMRTKQHTPGEARRQAGTPSRKWVYLWSLWTYRPTVVPSLVLNVVCALQRTVMFQKGVVRDVILAGSPRCSCRKVATGSRQAFGECAANSAHRQNKQPKSNTRKLQWENAVLLSRYVTPSLHLLALPLRMLQEPLCGHRAYGTAARRASGFPWRLAR